MGCFEVFDPAEAINRRALAENWPFACDGVLCFEQNELNALSDIWFSLAAKKGVPSRADFDARILKPFLRHIGIVERVMIDASKWRYKTRLSGSAIVEIAGDQTGRFLDEYIPAAFLPRWSSVYDAVLDGRAPLRVAGAFELPKLAYLNGESLVAPLVDARGNTSLVLSCLYFTPKQAAA